MNILCVASPAENVEAFSVTDQLVHQVTASTKNIMCTWKTPFSALSSGFILSILNNNTSSLLINSWVWRLIQINLGSHCIKHFRKKSHRSSGCLWKAISSVPGSLITPQPWQGSFILNCVSKLWRVNNKEGRVADFVWKGAQRKQAHSDRSTENHVALGSDKLKAHLKNRSFL